MNALTIQAEADRIFAALTADQIAYASSPERGEYQGFAALHDLFDANELLPGMPENPAEVFTHLDFCNAIMDRVSELILGDLPL